MIADTGGPAPPGSSERGLIVMSSQLHEHLQRQHSATNCLPHGETSCAEGKGPVTASQKAVPRTIRRAKAGLNSKLRAVCDGALRRSGGLQRLSLAFAIILAERRAPTDPDPLDLD